MRSCGIIPILTAVNIALFLVLVEAANGKAELRIFNISRQFQSFLAALPEVTNARSPAIWGVPKSGSRFVSR
jgi:hypothetical protein